jgi:hypothetical protein
MVSWDDVDGVNLSMTAFCSAEFAFGCVGWFAAMALPHGPADLSEEKDPTVVLRLAICPH